MGKNAHSLWPLVMVLAALAIPLGCESTGNDVVDGDDDNDDGAPDVDTDGDTDGDTDVDTDGDSDTDTEPGWDSNSENWDTDTEDGCVDEDSDGSCLPFDCDDDDPDVNIDASEIPDNDIDDDCDGNVDETSTGLDTDCGEQDFNVEIQPVRLMILHDFSGSMTEGSPQSKYEQAVPALTNVLNAFATSNIEFGFDIFPDGSAAPGIGGCGTTKPVIKDTAPANSSAIITYLNNHDPNGAATPLYCGMKRFLDDTYAPLFLADDANKYLLVVSDGADNCGTGCCNYLNIFQHPECVANTNQFKTLTQNLVTAGVKSMVIGFQVEADPGDTDAPVLDEDQLNAIAANGGTPYTDFFLAENGAELEAALTTVAQALVSCVYAIEPGTDVDPDAVNFYKDGVVVPMDEDCSSGAGWRWTDASHTAIEFCDETCDALAQGAEITAKFGCPTVVE